MTLAQHVANLIKDYGKSYELRTALKGCSSKRVDRRTAIEEILWDVLVEIYEQNPELKSKRGKYNQLKEED